MRMLRKLTLLITFCGIMAVGAKASATNVFLAQTATGGANGADCADALPSNYFNNGGNWGSAPNQIGPGTKVHLCGTFTGAPGSTLLTIQGSGASGNPVTILFESGAQVNSPYWAKAGAIVCDSANYITIDGGANGVISNTANGTSLSNQQASSGIGANNCSNFTVQNLTISNLYVRTSQSDENNNSFSTQGINIWGGDHITIQNNNINNTRFGTFMAYYSLTSYIETNNRINYSGDMIWVGDGNSNSTATGINIYGNTLGPYFNIWDDNNQNIHGDAIFVYAANPGSVASANVYNNTITGDMCQTQGNCTAYLFYQGMSNSNIFNNTVQHTGPTSGGGVESIVRLGDSHSGTGTDNSNIGIYNNTFVGGGQTALKSDAGSGVRFVNNIVSGMGQAYWDNSGNGFGWLSSSNNVLYSMTARMAMSSSGTTYATLQQWQSAGFDTGSSSANPQLTASLALPSVSQMAQIGNNLTNLNLAALTKDKNGVQRPGSGSWAAGAYQVSGNGPAPPSGVVAIVE